MCIVHFSNDRNGVTTFDCTNKLKESIDLKIVPQIDPSQGPFRLHFFNFHQDFKTKFKADCTARILAGLWCQAPCQDRERETQEVWSAALLAIKTLPNWWD